MDGNQVWDGIDPFWSENLMLGLVPGCPYQIHLKLLDLEPVSTTSSTIDYIIMVYYCRVEILSKVLVKNSAKFIQ